jgi:two-component system, response regulator FlrC
MLRTGELNMRLLTAGSLGGRFAFASERASAKGADVWHAADAEEALKLMSSGCGVDLLLVDVGLAIRDLVARLEASRIQVAVIACGIDGDVRTGLSAINSGASEYLPLPEDVEEMAAVIVAIAENDQENLGSVRTASKTN